MKQALKYVYLCFVAQMLCNDMESLAIYDISLHIFQQSANTVEMIASHIGQLMGIL